MPSPYRDRGPPPDDDNDEVPNFTREPRGWKPVAAQIGLLTLLTVGLTLAFGAWWLLLGPGLAAFALLGVAVESKLRGGARSRTRRQVAEALRELDEDAPQVRVAAGEERAHLRVGDEPVEFEDREDEQVEPRRQRS